MRSCLTVLGQAPHSNFVKAIEDLNNLQIWERLLGLTDKDKTQTPSRFANAIDMQNFEKHQTALEGVVNLVKTEFFTGISAEYLPPVRPISWH